MTAALPGKKINNRDKGTGHPFSGILRLYFCLSLAFIG